MRHTLKGFDNKYETPTDQLIEKALRIQSTCLVSVCITLGAYDGFQQPRIPEEPLPAPIQRDLPDMESTRAYIQYCHRFLAALLCYALFFP